MSINYRSFINLTVLSAAVLAAVGCNKQTEQATTVSAPPDNQQATTVSAPPDNQQANTQSLTPPRAAIEEKVEFALNCVSDKNGEPAIFVAVGNQAIFRDKSGHSQKYMSKEGTRTEAYSYNVDYEWTTFYGPFEKKNIVSKGFELIRDTLKLNYSYPDGRDPYSCTKASDEEAKQIYTGTLTWLTQKQDNLKQDQFNAEEAKKRKDEEQARRNKI
jgi:hypothetical protein